MANKDRFLTSDCSSEKAKRELISSSDSRSISSSLHPHHAKHRNTHVSLS